MPRTTKGSDGAKLQAIGFRTTPEIRGRLEDAAKASGRSLSQEVELRLVRSLDGDTLAALSSWIWGTPETELAIRLLSMAVLAIEGTAGQKWHYSDKVKREVEFAFLRILENIQTTYKDGAIERVRRDASANNVDLDAAVPADMGSGSVGITLADLVSATSSLGPMAKGKPSENGGPVVTAIARALSANRDGDAK